MLYETVSAAVCNTANGLIGSFMCSVRQRFFIILLWGCFIRKCQTIEHCQSVLESLLESTVTTHQYQFNAAKSRLTLRNAGTHHVSKQATNKTRANRMFQTTSVCVCTLYYDYLHILTYMLYKHYRINRCLT
jgi:hypothetical protein